jgi:glucosylceramidase
MRGHLFAPVVPSRLDFASDAGLRLHPTSSIRRGNSIVMSATGEKTSRRVFLQNAAKLAAVSTSFLSFSPPSFAQKLSPSDASVTCISTTQSEPWKVRPLRPPGWRWDTLDLQVEARSSNPVIDGFGACFNELGWTSLQSLSVNDREAIFQELFKPGQGANFGICRMPIGANDFSRGWYSYDETPDDFSLRDFTIANDLQTLVPFIQSAQKYNPALQLWASPWSPPTWMKKNKHYAEAEQRPGLAPNGIRLDQVGREGTDNFIQEDRYFEAYARYFGKFIDAYKQQGISVGMVMPQNEFNSAQAFPSCTWTPEGLAHFIRHLGPAMGERDVKIFFGTLERGNRQLLDQVMADPQAGRWIKGVGVQWAGKTGLREIHEQYPGLTIYQSEQECGDGKNDWTYAAYCWDLMKHYLKDGATGYMYWNLSLPPGGESHWGWPQNSLVTVDPGTRTYKFNPEYYLIKHVSHFVQPRSRRLETDGTFDNALAFQNPDGTIAIILRNESDRERPIDITSAGVKIPATMPPDSFSTLLLARSYRNQAQALIELFGPESSVGKLDSVGTDG